MTTMVKTLVRLALLYAGMVVLFTGLMAATYTVPSGMLVPQIADSADLLRNEGLYPRPGGIVLLQRDNFTDSWMLGISLSDESESLLRRAFLNPSYADGDMPDSHLAGLVKVSAGSADGLTEIYYGRYWHGYQVILRPLLLFLSLREIRVFNWTIFLAAAVLTLVLLVRRMKSPVAGAVLGAVLLLPGVSAVPSCMQYFTCHFLSLAAMCIILMRPSAGWTKMTGVCFFFVLGGLTSFLDLLSTPMLVLGFPLIAVIVVCANRRGLPGAVVILSAAWATGYLGIWGSKWIIAGATTGMDIVSDALEAVRFRTGAPVGPFNAEYFITRLGNGLWPVAAAAVICLIFLALRASAFPTGGALFLIVFLVPAWCLVARNHTFIHWWFVWRAFAVSLLATGLLLVTPNLNRKTDLSGR